MACWSEIRSSDSRKLRRSRRYFSSASTSSAALRTDGLIALVLRVPARCLRVGDGPAWRSCCRGAAIHHVNAASAVATLIRCEEQHHVCDLFGSPVAPQGKRALELFLGLTRMTRRKLFFD